MGGINKERKEEGRTGREVRREGEREGGRREGVM